MFAQMLLIILIHPQARCLMGWIKPKATISFSFNFLIFKSESLQSSMFVQMLLITLIQPKPHDHPQARRLPKATISWIHGQN